MHSSGSARGYSGANYDRFVDRRDDSTLKKLQQGYWTAKQAVRSKFGKKEDEHLVASDQELDAKLAVYYALRQSCDDMLRCIERYQDFICELSQEENSLGRFLKQHGKADKTQAGKMMSAVGRAQSYTAQQRLAMRVPLVRLYQELEVFSERAVEDCHITVTETEKARTEYRGSLLWMKNVSESLDPDTYGRLEKFRKVQEQVKTNKAKFDKKKLDCLQKVDLLAASRCNLFSQLMANYQNCLLHFWDRTTKAHSTVSENFKGYQHYEFTVLKDLSETSKRLAELTAGKPENPDDPKEAAERAEDELIMLEQEDALVNEGKEEEMSLEQLLFTEEESPETEQPPPSALNMFNKDHGLLELGSDERKRPKPDVVAPKLPPPPAPGSLVTKGIPCAVQSGQGQPSDTLLSLMPDEKSEKTEMELLDDILGLNPASTPAESILPVEENSFAYQWKHAFGQNSQGNLPASAAPAPAMSAPVKNQAHSDLAGLTAQSPNESPLHSARSTDKGFLPSQLLDMNFEADLMSGLNLGPAKNSHTTAPPTGSRSSVKPNVKNPGADGKKSNDTDKKNAWFNLFADLDPIQNPDAVGNPEGDSNNPC